MDLPRKGDLYDESQIKEHFVIFSSFLTFIGATSEKAEAKLEFCMSVVSVP
jgi:hypothetical protein